MSAFLNGIRIKRANLEGNVWAFDRDQERNKEVSVKRGSTVRSGCEYYCSDPEQADS